MIDKKEYSDEELDNFTWEEKTRLIQSDPVTCARHFDYQFQQFFLKFLSSNLSPLGNIEDWFYRVEFQQRGSPHIHMLLWIKGAPRFGVQSDEEVVDFINQVITCSKAANDITLSELVIRQYHSHSQSCKKKNRMVCRFNFPQPPMRDTVILYPLEDDIPASQKEKHKGEFRKLHEKLNDMKDGEDISFDDLLEKLGVCEENYILAIRASLVTATVFLKRDPNELRINNYNKSCLLAWRANMDVQYVLDVILMDPGLQLCLQPHNFGFGKSSSYKIVRKQFPLRLSAAKTIHRAKGDTEREVVVNLEASRKIPHIHYVALSRVTTLEGLYITNLNEEKICVSSKVEEEMNRLRTSAYLKPCLQLINQQDESFVKIMFLNARSLHKHFLDVLCGVLFTRCCYFLRD